MFKQRWFFVRQSDVSRHWIIFSPDSLHNILFRPYFAFRTLFTQSSIYERASTPLFILSITPFLALFQLRRTLSLLVPHDLSSVRQSERSRTMRRVRSYPCRPHCNSHCPSPFPSLSAPYQLALTLLPLFLFILFSVLLFPSLVS